MKILQINFEREWRGGERQTLYCMRIFRKLGHNVELLTYASCPLAERALQEGHVVHTKKSLCGLIKFLLRSKACYNIVHAQTAGTLTWAVLTFGIHQCPIVFSRRTAFLVKWNKFLVTKLKWKCISCFIAISEQAAAEPRRLGFKPVVIRSAALPRTVPQDNILQLMKKLDLYGRKILATMATLSKEKDPLTSIYTIYELRKDRCDFVFLHFGAEGSESTKAKKLVQSLGLQNVVYFLGFYGEAEQYFSIMDVFLLTSREEALGSSVLDAFIQRVPVVATSTGGLKESLSCGRGILCPVGDAKALSRAVAKCLDDNAFCLQMTQRAYEYVRKEHDIQAMGRYYLANFENLLEN